MSLNFNLFKIRMHVLRNMAIIQNVLAYSKHSVNESYHNCSLTLNSSHSDDNGTNVKLGQKIIAETFYSPHKVCKSFRICVHTWFLSICISKYLKNHVYIKLDYLLLQGWSKLLYLIIFEQFKTLWKFHFCLAFCPPPQTSFCLVL